MRKCCVPGCHSNYGKPYVPTFLFPRDSNRRKLWESNIGQINVKITNNVGVCVKHFSDDCFIRYDTYETGCGVRRKVKLKADASPTIFNITSNANQEENSVTKKASPVTKDMNTAQMDDDDDNNNDIEVIEVCDDDANDCGLVFSSNERSLVSNLPVQSLRVKEEDKVISKDNSCVKRRSSSVGSNSSTGSTEATKPSCLTPKRRKLEKNPPTVTGRENDCYCWVCHKEGVTLCCIACKRAYHQRCAGELECLEDWVCVECRKITAAENVDNQSKTLSEISLEKFCMLLKCCVSKLKCRSPAAFHQPVPVSYYSSYLDYVIHPMDLSLIEKNIKQKRYGCTESFLADVKWIQHNSCVFNGAQHPLTLNARSLVKTCECDMAEIEVCPDCYLHASTRNKYWFSDVCRKPHPIVWAKLKGFPYWPAKVVRILDDNVDARFFGAHDRAWVPISQCYHLSKEMPTSSKPKKKGNYETALEELNIHVQLLKQKYGVFEYAPYRTPFDPNNKIFLHHGIDVDKILEKDDPVKEDVSCMPSSSLNSSFSSNPATPYKSPVFVSDTSCDSKFVPKETDYDETVPHKVVRALSFESPNSPTVLNSSDSEATSAVKRSVPDGIFEISKDVKMEVDDGVETKNTACDPVSLVTSNTRNNSDLESLEKLQNSIDLITEMCSDKAETRDENCSINIEGSDLSGLNLSMKNIEAESKADTLASSSKNELLVVGKQIVQEHIPVLQDSSPQNVVPDVSDVNTELSLPITVVKKNDSFSQKLDETIKSCKAKLGITDLEVDQSSDVSSEEEGEDTEEIKDDTDDEESDSSSEDTESEDSEASSSVEESCDEDEKKCENNESKLSSVFTEESCINESESDKFSDMSMQLDECKKGIPKEGAQINSNNEVKSDIHGQMEIIKCQSEDLTIKESNKNLEVKTMAVEVNEVTPDCSHKINSNMQRTKDMSNEHEELAFPTKDEKVSPNFSNCSEVEQSNVEIEISNELNNELNEVSESQIEVEILSEYSDPLKGKESLAILDESKRLRTIQNAVVETLHNHKEAKKMNKSLESSKEVGNAVECCATKGKKESFETDINGGYAKGEEKENADILCSTSCQQKEKFPFLKGRKVEILNKSFTFVKKTEELKNQNKITFPELSEEVLSSKKECLTGENAAQSQHENSFEKYEVNEHISCSNIGTETSEFPKDESEQIDAHLLKNEVESIITEPENKKVITDIDEVLEIENEPCNAAEIVKSDSAVEVAKMLKENEMYELRKRPLPRKVIDVIDISSSDSESESPATESHNLKPESGSQIVKLNNKDEELIDDLLIDLSSDSFSNEQKNPLSLGDERSEQKVVPVTSFANCLSKNTLDSRYEKQSKNESVNLENNTWEKNMHHSTDFPVSNLRLHKKSSLVGTGYENQQAVEQMQNMALVTSDLKRSSLDLMTNICKKQKVDHCLSSDKENICKDTVDTCNVVCNSSLKFSYQLDKNNSFVKSDKSFSSKSPCSAEKSVSMPCQTSNENILPSQPPGDSTDVKLNSDREFLNGSQAESRHLSQPASKTASDDVQLLNKSGDASVCSSRIKENPMIQGSLSASKNEDEKLDLKAKLLKYEKQVKQYKELLELFKHKYKKREWFHEEELEEQRHNMNLILMEMRSSFEADKKAAIEHLRKQYEEEKMKAVMEAKGKQWCASCKEPSIFYCCWNTSYCSYSCQKHHWPQHRFFCTQKSTPPPLKSPVTEFVKIAKKPTAVESSEVSSADRRLLLVMKPNEEVLPSAVMPKSPATMVSKPSVTVVSNTLPVTVVTQAMPTTVSSVESVSTNHLQTSQVLPPKVQFVTPKNQFHLVSTSSVTTTAQPSTPLSFLPNQPVQIVLAPVKSLNEKAANSMPSVSRPVQDSSDIITKVRSRQTDLTTAIHLINKMNKETEETLKKKQPEDNSTEEVFLSLPTSDIDFNCSETVDPSSNCSGRALDRNSTLDEVTFEDESLVLPDEEEEEDEDSSSTMVSLGPGVEISEKRLKQCEKIGTTPTKLARCLLTVFFSMQDLAKSSVFGRKSNVTKQTRPALSMNIVNAILAFVGEKFPAAQRTDLVLAMNLKCKEARKKSPENQDALPSVNNKKPVMANMSEEKCIKGKSITKKYIVACESSTSTSPMMRSSTSPLSTTTTALPCILPQLSRALTTTIRNVLPAKNVQLVSTKSVTLSSSGSRFVAIPRTLQCTKNAKAQISIKPKPTIITAEKCPSNLLQIPSNVVQVSAAKSVSTSAKTVIPSPVPPLIYTVKNATKLDIVSSAGECTQTNAISQPVTSTKCTTETEQHPVVFLGVPASTAHQDIAAINTQESEASNCTDPLP